MTFTADRVEYDRERAIVTAEGSVEAWQNDNVLKADKITYDRNTNVIAASGHVVMVQPDGQVLFSDYAELTEGLRDGVLKGMRTLLAENGRLVANGARRTGGSVTEMSRAVYTTCNLCATDPTKPPLWQLRARSALQDGDNKRIEYRDAVLDIYGVPVAWFPYFTHVDPSVRRASGLLVPSFGYGKHLGAFLSVPYFLAIDEQSDATITPTFNSRNVLGLGGQYRHRFNDGMLTVDGSVGYDRHKPGADIFARGRFALNDTWRYGFDIDRASSATYLRDYRVANRGDVLTSRLYLEGFGTGSYSRIDTIAYQSLVTSVAQVRLPYVLPRYSYSYFGEPDAWGGRISFDTQDFNIIRPKGTNTQRVSAVVNWERPFMGALGEVYGLTLQGVSAAYSATSLNQNPNYASTGQTQDVVGHAQAALKVSWPFVRDTPRGSQLIEPIAQVILAPNTGRGRNGRIPNEDSLDFEFTDQNLFALNRYPGIDRLEGGARANVGLHVNWKLGEAVLDGLIGQSYRSHLDGTFPAGAGLNTRASDIVNKLSFSPAPWLDITARSREAASAATLPTGVTGGSPLRIRAGNVRFADVLATVGGPALRVGAGYLYSATNPYALYDTPVIPASYYQHRNEISLNASTQFLTNYRVSGFARRDVNLGKMSAIGMHASYEDECSIFDVNFTKRYTSLNGDTGATLILFQITLKTVGQFGYHAL